MGNQTHLFISYASEDRTFSDWLALKLVAEGYEVWYDRMKLLGGESYPTDIDVAIKNQSFRVLGLLSKHSVSKENPVKERTTALSISRDRGIKDFYIPLNVDGLEPQELPWMTSDLTFIPFHKGWSEGFVGLQKKLRSISTPRSVSTRQRVIHWFEQSSEPVPKPEPIWTNLIPILNIPDSISLYSIPALTSLEELRERWPVFPQNPALAWSFLEPPSDLTHPPTQVDHIQWRNNSNRGGINPRNIVAGLIREHLELYCEQRGLRRTSSDFLYFPKSLLEEDRLEFVNYNKKSTYVKSVGQWTFRTMVNNQAGTEISRYHLSPSFRPILQSLGKPFVRVGVGVYWTDLHGNELPTGRANRRRKALCKGWWNYEWYARITAIVTWLANGTKEINLCQTSSGNLVLGTGIVKLESPSSVVETGEPEEPEDSQILEEGEDED